MLKSSGFCNENINVLPKPELGVFALNAQPAYYLFREKALNSGNIH